MRTTLAIKEELLEEVKELSGAKTKKEAVEKALVEYIIESNISNATSTHSYRITPL